MISARAKGDALAHAAGQLWRAVLLETAQSNRRNQRPGAFVTLGLWSALHFEPEGDIVDDRAPRKQIEVLPDHDRMSAKRLRGAPLPANGDRAAGERLDATDDLRHRALAASAGPEDAGEVLRGKRVRHTIERDHRARGVAEYLCQVFDDDVHQPSSCRL